MKSKNTNIPLTQSSFVDCGKSIKEEDIKEEINEERSVGDPLSIHQDTESSNIFEDIKEEIIKEENVPEGFKEEESVEDPLSIHQRQDEEKNTFLNEIDIVEHKIIFDN